MATIKPIHSLAASLLKDVTVPQLLLKGGASPHSYALKPSDAEMLAAADIVVRVSKNLEVFLTKPLEMLAVHARVVDLDRSPGLELLPVREGGQGKPDNIDVHFWLDPLNAIAIAEMLARVLIEADPAHATAYRSNADRLKERLAALDERLRRELARYRNKPFLVFHDVTQYLEHRYGLSGLGAITISPERAPGAQRLARVREKIVAGAVVCVFAEPEFPPKLVSTLVEGTSARTGVLDEVGASIPEGPDQYFDLMEADAKALADCLGD